MKKKGAPWEDLLKTNDAMLFDLGEKIEEKDEEASLQWTEILPKCEGTGRRCPGVRSSRNMRKQS